MDAIQILMILVKYKQQEINGVDASLALIMAGCSSIEAFELLNKAAWETKLNEAEYYVHEDTSLMVVHFSINRPIEPGWHKVSKSVWEALNKQRSERKE